MAITIVGTSGGTDTSSAPINIPIPTHQADDWLLVFFGQDGSAAPGSPSTGWTLVRRDTFTDAAIYLVARKATASGTTLSIDANEYVAWNAYVVRGADVADTTALASMIGTSSGASSPATFASVSGLDSTRSYASIVAQSGEGGTNVISAAPTGWSNYLMNRSGTQVYAGAIATADRIFSGLTTVSPPATAMGSGSSFYTYHVVIPELLTFTGSGGVTAPAATGAASGTFAKPTFSGSGAATAPPATAAGSGTYRPWGKLVAPMPIVAGAGTFTKPVYTGAVSTTAPAAVVAGSAVAYTWPSPVIPVLNIETRDVLYGDRVTTYRWEVLSHSNNVDKLVGELDGVTDGSLRWTWNAAVKGGGKIQVADLDQAAPGKLRIADLDLATVRLRPVCNVAGLPENPLGVFLVESATEEWEDTGRVWNVGLLDKTTVASQDQVDQSYSVAAGTPILQHVKSILTTIGESIDVDLSNTTATSGGMAWDAGTSRLKIINDLLDVAGFNALTMDGYGNLRVTPRVLPADRSILYEVLGIPRELVDGRQSIYRPEWTRERDSFAVPNKVIAVQSAGGEDAPALTGVWTNTDPASPYSYQARGRWITHVLDGVETPDGSGEEVIASLQSRARATLIQMSAVQAQVKVTHLPIPIRVGDVIRFAHTRAGVDARHVVMGLELELNSTGLMKSTLQEVISL